MKSFKTLALLFLVISIGLIFIFSFNKKAKLSKEIAKATKISTVKINSNVIEVTVARTPAEKSKGLSGTQILKANQGMLFEFNPKTKPNFWMKDMYIPLDMIWIADGKIIGIEKNVPAPDPGTPDASLDLYYPSAPVDYVLEVNAGYSDNTGIKEGDSVQLNLI